VVVPVVRKGVAAAGNFIVDRVKFIDAWPEEERLANVLGEARSGGGGAHNVLIDLALMKADFPLRAIGLVGDDADGRWLIDEARGLGVDVSALGVTRDAPTSYTEVMTVRSNGRRTFFHNRGANALLEDRHIDPGNCRLFHLAYLLLLDRIDPVGAEVLRRVRSSGAKTSLDLVSADNARFQEVVVPALEHVDYLVLNEIEAGLTTGHAIRRADRTVDRDALKASARKLFRDNLVVIHMPEAAYALSRHGDLWVPSRPVERVVSSVGAGDAFCAGVLYGIHENWALELCLDFGHRAAAACLGHETTTGGLRPASDL
jgi:sugar/nucleoside kinase (ribokinase family)